MIKKSFSILFMFIFLIVSAQENDLKNNGTVVFMGDSITEGWIAFDSAYFYQNNYINKGIGGQTTGQMLNRFVYDVISQHPKAVVILGGINDLSGKFEEINLEKIKINFIEMAKLADENGVELILSSILPVDEFPFRKDQKPVEHIKELNLWLENYAETNGYGYVDYYSAMINRKSGLKKKYSQDGIHPNQKGYSLMKPILQKEIDKILAK